MSNPNSKTGVKIRVLLNGKETEVDERVTLLELLEEMKIIPQMVACELNSKIVKRSELARTHISEGDQVEILQMIGGG